MPINPNKSDKKYTFDDVASRAFRFICEVYDGERPIITEADTGDDDFEIPNTPQSQAKLKEQEFLMDLSVEIIKKYKGTTSSDPDDDGLRRQARMMAIKEMEKDRKA